jgi:hypothetical protein
LTAPTGSSCRWRLQKCTLPRSSSSMHASSEHERVAAPRSHTVARAMVADSQAPLKQSSLGPSPPGGPRRSVHARAVHVVRSADGRVQGLVPFSS